MNNLPFTPPKTKAYSFHWLQGVPDKESQILINLLIVCVHAQTQTHTHSILISWCLLFKRSTCEMQRVRLLLYAKIREGDDLIQLYHYQHIRRTQPRHQFWFWPWNMTMKYEPRCKLSRYEPNHFK